MHPKAQLITVVKHPIMHSIIPSSSGAELSVTGCFAAATSTGLAATWRSARPARATRTRRRRAELVLAMLVLRCIDGWVQLCSDEMVYIGELAGLSVAYLSGLAFLV
jgi:hypothetical protein